MWVWGYILYNCEYGCLEGCTGMRKTVTQIRKWWKNKNILAVIAGLEIILTVLSADGKLYGNTVVMEMKSLVYAYSFISCINRQYFRSVKLFVLTPTPPGGSMKNLIINICKHKYGHDSFYPALIVRWWMQG